MLNEVKHLCVEILRSALHHTVQGSAQNDKRTGEAVRFATESTTPRCF